ncbi:hypothetical protein MRB53_018303 [Persea americana]|uniref:Uncharacterized protein n=1 Tax=Persea americana TaxID=3435 RepID=A0ACC2M8F2_PERAE|nr:hypothetical protein MRB53_018303 [Persea americana]
MNDTGEYRNSQHNVAMTRQLLNNTSILEIKFNGIDFI